MTVIELILFLPARECTSKVQAEQMLNATMKDQLKPEPWRCFDDIECDMVGIVLRADYNCIVI
jgi:hypothetical protein